MLTVHNPHNDPLVEDHQEVSLYYCFVNKNEDGNVVACHTPAKCKNYINDILFDVYTADYEWPKYGMDYKKDEFPLDKETFRFVVHGKDAQNLYNNWDEVDKICRIVGYEPFSIEECVLDKQHNDIYGTKAYYITGDVRWQESNLMMACLYLLWRELAGGVDIWEAGTIPNSDFIGDTQTVLEHLQKWGKLGHAWETNTSKHVVHDTGCSTIFKEANSNPINKVSKAIHEELFGDKELVFVYGTLKKGFCNHHVLGDGKAFVSSYYLGNYKMYDLGGFPCISYSPGSRARGELWMVDKDQMERIDGLEGYPSFYDRKKVNTLKGEAHVYFFPIPPNAPVVPNGVWMKK